MDEDAISPASDHAWLPGEVLATVDGQGILTAWSAAAQRLLGYEPGEVIGRGITRLLPERLPDSILRCCVEQRAWHDLITVRRRDGRLLRVGVQGNVLWDARGGVQWSLARAATTPLRQRVPAAPANRIWQRSNAGHWSSCHCPRLSTTVRDCAWR
ncbi:hypothetical protein AQI96_33780 [Streptomyces canus]|nr:hypothetical protein AQI96_33780 [Streptomyces canus]